MLSRDLLTQTLPRLKMHDKIYHALQMMNDYHIAHLPVVDEEKFAGLVSE